MHVLFTTTVDVKYGTFYALLDLIQSLITLDPDIKISVVLPNRCNRKEDFRQLGCDVYKAP